MAGSKRIRRYDEPAGGWGALKALGERLIEQNIVVKGPSTLLRMNQPQGFDCPGCAWPEARQKAPCIIFIDEIDAVGRARSVQRR